MLEGVNLVDLSPAALAGLFVLLLLTGRVVPRSVLMDVRADRDDRLRDKETQIEDLREANRTCEAARAVLAEQNSELLENSRATITLFKRITNADVDV